MTSRLENLRLLYVVAHPMTARYLLEEQLSFMRRVGFEVAVACTPGADLEFVANQQGVKTFPVDIQREISPLSDIKAVLQLTRLMRRWRPEIVNAGTAKAGLLGMIAARAAGVPGRIYMLRGLRLETTAGLKRQVLLFTERIASGCADEVIAVSHSLASRYLALGLAHEDKLLVLGSGSSKGVDIERFSSVDEDAVAQLRTRLSLPDKVPVIGFVGRLTRDKGIFELVQAFEAVLSTIPEARLLLVGDFEVGDPVPEPTIHRIHSHPSIVHAGFLSDTAPAYALMDVLAFPSYREGFPNVPLEAAAAGLPVVGFRATGTVDAVLDGETGMLVDVGDVEQLVSALTAYLADAPLRSKHGRAGQVRVRAEFQPERIWGALLNEYKRLLKKSIPTADLGTDNGK